MSRAERLLARSGMVIYPDIAMSFDDPEYLDCTCVHRKLRDHEAIYFVGPKGEKWIVAKDCPVHGMVDVTPEQVNQAPPKT